MEGNAIRRSDLRTQDKARIALLLLISTQDEARGANNVDAEDRDSGLAGAIS